MIRAPDELIEDLKAVFKKHDINIDVNDEYDGMGNYNGRSVEICSNTIVGGRYPVLMDDMDELADILNR